ncbi:hypothetical protein ZTR_03616 [Talaromyces verruculosus]|nr:hypothetical protein ZTR_03616 [Talaromyces verruculosus]
MDLAQMGIDNNVNTLHQLEEELDTNIYPGTEVMTDVGSHHFVKSPVSNIWRAVAKDYGSFMGACILNGIGAGPAEPTIIADVMFLHERGFWNTLYFTCYFGSLMDIFPNPRPSIKLFAFPIVEFSSFVVSWCASSFLTLNLTQSQNFAAPPYNFSSQSIGFMNLATFVGSMIGLLTNGPLSDWIADRATKKNKGIREPEMRLPALIPYVLIMLVGNFVVAFGYQYKWDWRIIVIIGYTCAGIQVAALPSIASTYSVDSYKPVAVSIFVAITVNKNLWGYGFSEFLTNCIIDDGYLPPIMLNMCLIFLWCSVGILFYFKGKSFRKWTRNSLVHDI